jgi:hypothetical protein
LSLQSALVDATIKSEDNETERFQGTIVFKGPVLSPRYPKPSMLTMTLLWVLEDNRWWLERPLSIQQSVSSDDRFPTAAQQEAAARFQAAVAVLDKIGLVGDADAAGIGRRTAGSALEDYRELDRLAAQEVGSGGVDPEATGVDVLLRAASRAEGGLLKIYYGDFKDEAEDTRKPFPWEAFRAYVTAAFKRAKTFEKRGNVKAAERIYRHVVALGRQLLDEPGGFTFAHWGLVFQKEGAEELARLLAAGKNGNHEGLGVFPNLVSRRLDSLQTAFNCLDDLADYRALAAAIAATEMKKNDIFLPWSINTLTIYALKGAPADQEAVMAAGGTVVVLNPAMQKLAAEKLEGPASSGSGKRKAFIEMQRDWVRGHSVYGEIRNFR